MDLNHDAVGVANPLSVGVVLFRVMIPSGSMAMRDTP